MNKPVFVVDGVRQPKPPPMSELLLRLHPEPLVIVTDDAEGWQEYRAWLPTVADQLALT